MERASISVDIRATYHSKPLSRGVLQQPFSVDMASQPGAAARDLSADPTVVLEAEWELLSLLLLLQLKLRPLFVLVLPAYADVGR